MADDIELDDDTRITVTLHGPYMLEGEVPIQNASGEDVTGETRVFLCRCGQSSTEPFCDGSHWYAEFKDPA